MQLYQALITLDGWTFVAQICNLMIQLVIFKKLLLNPVKKVMAERKAKMIGLGDAFIAFPGGTGTLEEIAEVMSAVSLGHLDAPCILYNLGGYYNDLKALLEHMIDKGLSSPRRQHGIYFADDLREIASIING